jgi:hypothetical protein
MKVLRLLAGIVCGVALLGAQNSPQDLFEKAPPEVDEALRARITLFYQAHVDGRFRQADQVVAEDSKDRFFAMQKPRYKGFEITRIRYTEDFTKATALVTCDTEMPLLNGQRIPVKRPIGSQWRLEDGEWVWFVVPPEQGQKQTPFGMMTTNEPGGAGRLPINAGGDLPSMIDKVRVNKNELLFASDAPGEDSIEIHNGMDGVIRLSISAQAFGGLTLKLADEEVRPNQKTKLLVSWAPASNAAKPPVAGLIVIDPTGDSVPFVIKFAVPSTGPIAPPPEPR